MQPVDTVPEAPAMVVGVLEGMQPTEGTGPGQAVSPRSAIVSGAPEARLLVDAFLNVVTRRADHPAIVVGEDRFSYRDVARAALTTARFLLSQPTFEPGSRVALAMENCAEYLAGFFGVLLADGVVVPVPPNTEAGRLGRILSACDVATLLANRRAAARLVMQGSTTHRSIDLGQPAQAPVSAPEAAVASGPVEAGKLAAIMFTSGSTGEPKGVMLTNANLLANARSIIEYLPIDEDDRALALLPFCHAFGNSVLQTHLLVGATLVVDGSLTFPGTVPDALRRHRATSFSGVPETYHLLMSYADLQKDSLPEVRYMAVAGGALEPRAALEVAERLAPAEFYVMYGQTEATARLAYLPPDELRTRAGSIGKAIPGVELKVVDEQGRRVEPGAVGDLCARGPNVMLGYWNDPETTAGTIEGGWLRTGDVATVDREGYVFVQSRKDDLIKTQGLRTHPREIEELVVRHFPGFRAVVLPYRFHNATRLALYLISGSTAEQLPVAEIRRLCLRALPRPKVPSYIEVLERAPLNESMKLDREGLVRRAERQSAATGGAPGVVSAGNLAGADPAPILLPIEKG